MSPRNKFYGLALAGSSFLWLSVFLVQWQVQKRASRGLQSKIDQLAEVVKEIRSAPAPAPVEQSASVASASSVVTPFRILGTGRLGRVYTYMDIRHVDGSKRRYYCRNEDGMAGVQRMFAIIDADSYDAEYNLLWLEDETRLASRREAFGLSAVE